MDYSLSPEQKALRQEIEGFAEEESKRAPEGWAGGFPDQYSKEGWEYHLSVARRAGQKGFLSMCWPKEYGGRGYGVVEQLIFTEVMGYYKVPAMPVHYNVLSAAILEFGTEDQKREWLPKMASAEVQWAECFSEPDAGSDVASMKTSATPDGDDYVINGCKVWTTGGHKSNYAFILARTHPDASLRHKGLTFFLSPVGPGMTFRPLVFMNGGHEYNETLLENFRVPKNNVLGEINKGWYVMQAGRNISRSDVWRAALGKSTLDDLIEYCKQAPNRPASEPKVRQTLAEFAAEYEAAIQMAYRAADIQSKGRSAAVEAAACGYFTNELNLRLARAAVEIMGLYGTIKPGSKWAPLYGRFETQSQFNVGLTIAGGTTEIRKNVIAWMGLDLPRN